MSAILARLNVSMKHRNRSTLLAQIAYDEAVRVCAQVERYHGTLEDAIGLIPMDDDIGAFDILNGLLADATERLDNCQHEVRQLLENIRQLGEEHRRLTTRPPIRIRRDIPA